MWKTGSPDGAGLGQGGGDVGDQRRRVAGPGPGGRDNLPAGRSAGGRSSAHSGCVGQQPFEIGGDRIAEFGGADDAMAGHGDVAGAMPERKRLAHRRAQRGVGLRPAETFAQHHAERQDLADRVGDVLAGDVARGAMAGLVDGMAANR